MQRKTDSNNPADCLLIVESDMELLRQGAAHEWSFAMCRSKLAEVLERKVAALASSCSTTPEEVLPHVAVLHPAAVPESRGSRSLRDRVLAVLRECKSAAAAAVVTAMQAQHSDKTFYFGAVEDFGGLERGLVVVTGFSDLHYLRRRFGLADLSSYKVLVCCVCVACVCERCIAQINTHM